MLALGSVVGGFLPPNFSQKKIYCAVVKVDRLPHHHHVYCSFNHHHHCHSGYSSFNHHHHVYCLSSSLYFTCLFRIAFVDPSMEKKSGMQKKQPSQKPTARNNLLKQPSWKICSSNWIIFAGIGVKVKNVSNHHLEKGVIILPTQTRHNYKGNRSKFPYICIVWSPPK